RFAASDSQLPPDGIILLGGSGLGGVAALAALSWDYAKTRLIFSGYRNNPASFKIFTQIGGDPARIICIEPRPRNWAVAMGTRCIFFRLGGIGAAALRAPHCARRSRVRLSKTIANI